MSKSFIPYQLTHGLLEGFGTDEFPSTLWGFYPTDDDDELVLPEYGTHFGYVYSGRMELNQGWHTFPVSKGMYFSAAGKTRLYSSNCQAAVITRLDYRGTFMIGGPIEPEGRLRYINGASDSLLIPPVMCGDPCLNALYFPPGISQTPHTHSSMRIGMIVSGRGECITPDETIPLEPGQVFVIPAGALHSFRTGDSPLTVIAYHPDSSYGPTHEWHPMVISTLVDGINAPFVKEILTSA